MVTFLTVLKSSERINTNFGHAIYKPAHVFALQEQIKRHYLFPHEFICFTDLPESDFKRRCTVVKLKNNWPGWWSKIELFREDVKNNIKGEKFFYFDLDTVIVNDFSVFVNSNFEQENENFAGLEINTKTYGELALHDISVMPRLNSSIMSWTGNHSDIYKLFLVNPQKIIDQYKVVGDQNYIFSLRKKFKALQDFSDGIYSYKSLLKRQKDLNSLPVDAKIMHFHGDPKPWDLTYKWLDKDTYLDKAYNV